MIEKLVKINYNLIVVKCKKENRGYACNKWTIECNNGYKYFLKEMKTNSIERINFINFVQNKLSKKTVAPKIIKTINKKNYFIFDNKIYVLYEFISSDVINNIIPYNAGKLLAQIHILLNSLNVDIHNKNFDIDCIKFAEPRIKEINILIKLYTNNDFEYKILKDKLNKLKNYKINFNGMQKSIIHGDFYLDNIIVNQDKYVIIDFDQCCYFYSMYELFRAIMKFCYNSNDESKKILKQIKEFVLGYDSNYNITEDDFKKGINLYLYMQLNDLYYFLPENNKALNMQNYIIKKHEELLWLNKNKSKVINIIKTLREND